MTARNFYRVDAAGRIEKLSGSILKELTGAATDGRDSQRHDLPRGLRRDLLFVPRGVCHRPHAQGAQRMIYVIALRQAARTGDRWQVLPRAYYSVCEALADARRARLRFPLLDFRVARRPTAEKLPDIYRW